MNLKKILKNFALTEKEAMIYLTCLELDSASVYKISKKSGLPRSTCYEIIDDLQAKGLVLNFRKKKVNYYMAEDPKKIIKQTEENIKLFKEALPNFEAIYKSSRVQPNVRFYQGFTGMRTILEEILEERPSEILGFTSGEDHFDILGKYWLKFVKQRLKLKIPVRSIITQSPKAYERKKLGLEELRQVKIIPAPYKHHGLLMLWKDKIGMFSFEKEMAVLIIESHALSQMQKTMFNLMWDSLTD